MRKRIFRSNICRASTGCNKNTPCIKVGVPGAGLALVSLLLVQYIDRELRGERAGVLAA
ncbi:MAG: hypothetical protein FWH34_06400 [Desulfovibrionaceae bacterium]|nr:hypothetical protein [Desulfovibrionaceae bacterium]